MSPMSLIRLARRTARAVALASLPALASCEAVVSRSKVLSFLEAVQRPFDLQDRTWLGIPVAVLAHLIVSASLAGALAWLWLPQGRGGRPGDPDPEQGGRGPHDHRSLRTRDLGQRFRLGRGCPGFGRRSVSRSVGRHPGPTKSCRERLRRSTREVLPYTYDLILFIRIKSGASARIRSGCCTGKYSSLRVRSTVVVRRRGSALRRPCCPDACIVLDVDAADEDVRLKGRGAPSRSGVTPSPTPSNLRMQGMSPGPAGAFEDRMEQSLGS